jgi:hypothetical protein
MSQGKAALPAARERSRDAKRAPPAAPAAPGLSTEPSLPPPSSPAPASCGHASCREAAKARRMELSRHGRGSAPAAPPSRPPRQGVLDYAPKVVASPTQGGQSVTGQGVTGLRASNAAPVTGAGRGGDLPISGTQYIGADGGGWRAAGLKVGLVRTSGGVVVSGTLVRGKAPVTGDEAGAGVAITGEADQRLDDDLTPRPGGGVSAAGQFRRQADPHGTAAFGGNLARSAAAPGSRQRARAPALEATDSGLPITGSALGRSARVTGDEDGACRSVTGSQYLSPARLNAQCGGPAPGSTGHERPDPVTRGKVRVSRTFAGQRLTGVDVEHDPRVTGEAPGSCQIVTGSPYQGVLTMAGWCDAAAADEAEARLIRRPPMSAVTGGAFGQGGPVTGVSRGAAQSITGTRYQVAVPAPSPPAEPVAAIDAGFSVRSPQRAAHLRAAGTPEAGAAGRITGAFAQGQDKVTGNTEFLFRPRLSSVQEGKAARDRITGEGRPGRGITGDAWGDRTNVTGVEGAFATGRNPSERSGGPRPFAGARTFKSDEPREEPKQLVTGMFGFSSKASAKVTLSGGAQG